MKFTLVKAAALAGLCLAMAPAASAQVFGEVVYLEDGRVLIVSEQGVFPVRESRAAELIALNAQRVMFVPPVSRSATDPLKISASNYEHGIFR